jgi:hypothetical protein
MCMLRSKSSHDGPRESLGGVVADLHHLVAHRRAAARVAGAVAGHPGARTVDLTAAGAEPMLHIGHSDTIPASLITSHRSSVVMI